MFCLLSQAVIGLLIICIFRRAAATAVSTSGTVPPIELYADSPTDSFMRIVIPLESMRKVEFAVRASGFDGNHTFNTPVDIQWAVFAGGPDDADAILCQFFALSAVGEREDEFEVADMKVDDMERNWPERRFTDAAVSEPFRRGESMTDLEGVTGVYCAAYFVERQPLMKWDEIL